MNETALPLETWLTLRTEIANAITHHILPSYVIWTDEHKETMTDNAQEVFNSATDEAESIMTYSGLLCERSDKGE
mgnify:FL=1